MTKHLDPIWEVFCERGRYPIDDQRSSVRRCMGTDGIVRGRYSDLPLDPTLRENEACFPAHDHVIGCDDSEMVVDSRFVVDMKGLLSENEFWAVIAHLASVGIERKKINQPQRLPSGWKPKRNY
jgi:hypothetical protein